MRVPLLKILACLWWAMCWVGAVHAASVVIVSSERSAGYTDAASALVGELERTGVPRSDILLLLGPESAGVAVAGEAAPRLFVTLGADALKQMLARDVRVPVLAALIPRSSVERVRKESSNKITAVTALYLDQPFGRQLDLLRLALPAAKRIGVLWGTESVQQQPLLVSALTARGLSLVSGSVALHGSLFGGLKTVLNDADVLLAVADPQVFNSATISSILLSTYRERTPVLAFSPAYVKAGALLSLHTTPEQVGVQAATMARTLLQAGALPPTQYPADFSVNVNEHVARSLGLTLNAVTLTDSLRRMDKRP